MDQHDIGEFQLHRTPWTPELFQRGLSLLESLVAKVRFSILLTLSIHQNQMLTFSNVLRCHM